MNGFSRSSIAVTLLLLIFFTGCDSSDEPVAPCIMTSQQTNYYNGDFAEYVFGYENQDAVHISLSTMYADGGGGSTTFPFTYDSNGKIIGLGDYNGSHERYVYKNGDIIRRTYYSGITLLDQTDYEYENGKLVKAQDYLTSFQPVKSGYRIYEYARNTKKNPIRILYYNSPISTEPYDTREITYLNKKSPNTAASSALQKYLALIEPGVEKCVSKIVFSSGYTVYYNYDFNDNGYPLKRTEVYSGRGANTTVYTYGCK